MGTAWLAKEAADGPHGVSGVTLASRDGPPLRKEAMPLMTRRAVRSRLFLLAVVVPLLAVTLTACFGSSRSSVTPKPGPTPVPTGRLIVNSDPQNAEIFLWTSSSRCSSNIRRGRVPCPFRHRMTAPGSSTTCPSIQAGKLSLQPGPSMDRPAAAPRWWVRFNPERRRR